MQVRWKPLAITSAVIVLLFCLLDVLLWLLTRNMKGF